MAILSNINGKFAVDSTGAIELSGDAGAANEVLVSGGAGVAAGWANLSTNDVNSAPYVGGPYLELTGGTLSGNLSLTGASNPSLTVTTGATVLGGTLDVSGIITAPGGTSTEWNTAYDNSIVSLGVTGTTTKTLTATQQDGGTLTASWTDGGGTVTSSAAAGYIPYMSTTTNVANSQLFYDTTNSRTILTGTVGAVDDVRGTFIVRDDTAMAADIGGQIALGYKYLTSGGYTEGALIRTYKLNATDGDYSSGLKIQVRNTGANLSTKFTLDPSGNVTIPGIYTATGGTSTEWNTAYDNSITGLAVTGTTTKTLTATQQDGGTLTASWADNDSNTTWPNVGAGIRTDYTLGFKPPTNGYAGFYFQTSAAAGAGYFLIRGQSASGAYTDEGISLIADAGWLSLVSRTTTNKGVRIMSGATTAERLVITSAGDSYFTGNLGIGVTSPGSQLEIKAPDTSGSPARTIVTRQLTLNANGGNNLQPYEGFGTGIIFEGYDYAGGGGTSGPRDYAYIDSIIENSGSTPVDFRSQLKFHTNPGGSSTQIPTVKMVIEGGGNVGIGTDSPTQKLHIYDGAGGGSAPDARTKLLIEDDGEAYLTFNVPADSYSGIRLQGAGTVKALAEYYATANSLHIGTIDATGTLEFHTTNSVKMIIAANGNVGIGTTTPYNPLSVIDDNSYSYYTSTSPYRTATFQGDGNTSILVAADGNAAGVYSEIRLGNAHDYYGNYSPYIRGTQGSGIDSYSLEFGTSQSGVASTVMYIGGASGTVKGNVGIGTTLSGAQNEKLFVDGTVRQQSTIGTADNVRNGLGAYDNTTGWAAGIGGQLVLGYIYTGPYYTEGAIIKMYKENSSQGHYGSGLKFQVRNNGANLSTKLTLDPSGNLTATGDVTAYSDERLKSNIKTLDGSKVYNMRGVSFDKNGKKGSGVIAQELEKIAPELVHNEQEYKAVAYGNLTGYLIEAIKELEARVKELENK